MAGPGPGNSPSGDSKGAKSGRQVRSPGPARVKRAVRTLLAWMGEDPDAPGLAGTPERVAQSLRALTDEGGSDLRALMEREVFEEKDAGLVLIRDVEFYSLCEHHLLPFFGRCHVAYLPGKHLVGFSRIPRLVDHFARRLQVQERLTRQVVEALQKAVKPRGVACIVEGFHLCMAMRGVRKQQAQAVTTAYSGLFQTDLSRRQEVLGLLRGTPARPVGGVR